MIYIIMGVSGCGKSSLGAVLSEKLGWTLHEGDNFHPQENVEKMARGEPLTDEDRLPWLLQLHEVIQRERCSGSDALVTCSALKRHYRWIMLHGAKALDQDILPPIAPDVFFLFLQEKWQTSLCLTSASLLRLPGDALDPYTNSGYNIICGLWRMWIPV
ncbi:probable gluconokinase isoform X2 [Scophthalmus maximus]|uniref:probable gluconokinase isoform X2 n=1 Tax=Scophthalmus maximus TaxID=52904 RepID=UPI0015E0A05A|nr:probable gluconokinase isoform X2 [Scophthalmus maximus]